jgi:predicted RNA-binding Zn ribbon-like protein
MVETEIQAPIFEFSGNNLCLDFANTLQDRSSNPHDLLKSYGDLVRWGLEGHLLTASDAQKLLAEAASRPAEASTVLERAITLREAIFRIFAMVAEDAAPVQADLDILNEALSQVMPQARIVPTASGFHWDWTGRQEQLDRMLLAVVRSAADLLTSEQLEGVRMCASEDCSWLFLDTSKNHSRRWCDMKSCGNRAKARRHYGRKKTSPLRA